MTFTSPLFITSRLMVGINIGKCTIHIMPIERQPDNRVAWEWIIEDENYKEIGKGKDLNTRGEDPRSAMSALLSFLGAAADALSYETRTGRKSDNSDLFSPEVTEWAHQHSDELAILGCDLEEQYENQIRADE